MWGDQLTLVAQIERNPIFRKLAAQVIAEKNVPFEAANRIGYLEIRRNVP
jgi:hypothetical protein